MTYKEKVFNPFWFDTVMKSRKITQKEFAKQSNLTQGYISKMICGIHIPTKKQINRFAQILQCPKEIFFEPGRECGRSLSLHPMDWERIWRP